MSSVEPLARIPIGVVVERRRARSAWTDFVWRPSAVLAGAPDAEPWTLLDGDAERATFYAGATELELHRSESGNYRDNLATDTPMLWVVLQRTEAEPPFAVATVTVDPAEGEALATIGADLVEALPMPAPIRSAVAAFVAEHYVEQVEFSKRQRDRADPEALASRAPIKRSP
jgi:hypothetical protein